MKSFSIIIPNRDIFRCLIDTIPYMNGWKIDINLSWCVSPDKTIFPKFVNIHPDHKYISWAKMDYDLENGELVIKDLAHISQLMEDVNNNTVRVDNMFHMDIPQSKSFCSIDYDED